MPTTLATTHTTKYKFTLDWLRWTLGVAIDLRGHYLGIGLGPCLFQWVRTYP